MSVLTILFRSLRRTSFQAVLLPVVAAMSTAPVSPIEVIGEPLRIGEFFSAEVFVGALLTDFDSSQLSPGPSFEALLRFPSGVFNRPVFSSALTERNGNLEVGVDNLGGLRNSMTAVSHYNATVVNDSDDEVLRLRFDFFLPSGEIVLLDPRGLDPRFSGGPTGGVSVKIHYSFFGSPVVDIFDFGLDVAIEDGKVKTTPTGDIVFREKSSPTTPSLHTFVVDAFEGSIMFPDIPPHATFIFAYEMFAFGNTGGVFETGYLARIGDPLDLVSASDDARIILTTAVADEGVAPQALVVDTAAGAVSDGNGVFEPGETVLVEPAWRNNDDGNIELTGAGSAPDGPIGPTYATSDAAASYGSIAPDATKSCSETGDCYSISISDPATRPAPHWDATFTETVDPGSVPKVWTLHLGESFPDVPRSQPFYKKVETIFHKRITVGCSPTEYCPAQKVPRSQMAIFIARALGRGAGLPAAGLVEGAPYDCVAGGTSLFTDVPPESISCKAVHFIAARNVAAGCAPSLFCPGPNVTRAEMAVFMAKGMVAPGGGDAVPETYGPDPVTGLAYSCDAGSPSLHFSDVSTSDPFCKHAHFLWARGVIAGCSASQYCPLSEVGRDEMAKFLANAFDLDLYGR